MDPVKFLEIISPNKDDPTVFKLGTIPNTYTSGRPTILFDGESVASARTYPCLSSYVPAANDRVLLALVGHVFTVIGKIDSGASPWIDLALLGTWRNYSTQFYNAGCYKDSIGIVHLRGLITAGAAGSSIALLPIGLRPSKWSIFPAWGMSSTLKRVDILADGTISLNDNITNGSDLSLEGITFRAEQ